MKFIRSRVGIVAVALVLATWVGAAGTQEPAGVSADDARERLVRGNERFVSGKLAPKHLGDERHALVKDQHPYAIVLTCSDSRVSPELLFDESLGKLFVIRVAGNVVDPVVLGSVEYAAEHLHSHLLVVLGHDGCGGVKAALEGGHVSENLGSLTTRIAPAAESAKKEGVDAARTLDAAVRGNVRLQVERSTSESAPLAALAAKGELEIVGGVYHLESGRVDWLPTAAKREPAR